MTFFFTKINCFDFFLVSVSVVDMFQRMAGEKVLPALAQLTVRCILEKLKSVSLKLAGTSN